MTAAPEPRGDCYEAAALYMLDHRDQAHLRLVHGEVAGQGKLLGVTLGHAWVEDGGTVIDRSMGRDIRMPKWRYLPARKGAGNQQHSSLHLSADG